MFLEYKGLEGSAGAVPGEELDIVAHPPPKSTTSSSEKQPLHVVDEAADTPSHKTIYGTYTEKLSGSQRLVALAFVVAIIFVVYKSRRASQARAVLQEKTMA